VEQDVVLLVVLDLSVALGAALASPALLAPVEVPQQERLPQPLVLVDHLPPPHTDL
jgi:hypothetical protein